MFGFKNELHNEAIQVEYAISDITSALTNLSNYLYSRNPDHELCDWISSAIGMVEDIPIYQPYEAAAAEAGDAWWEREDDKEARS